MRVGELTTQQGAEEYNNDRYHGGYAVSLRPEPQQQRSARPRQHDPDPRSGLDRQEHETQWQDSPRRQSGQQIL
ncbi:hypothetical protein GCM10027298_37060 [Epidermidibacterium keratini]